ncbi:hypothetical protein OG21DRAFT_1571746, partial [Imleria badia]
MPGHRRTVSPNLKAQIPLLYHDNYSVKEICRILCIKKSLFYKTLSLYSRYGTVTNPSKYSLFTGCRRVFSTADITLISTIIQHHGTIYLDELQHELWAKHHKYAMPSTLLRALQCLCVTWKVVSCAAAERNEETHAIYMNCIAADVPDPNMLIFIDEAAKDK